MQYVFPKTEEERKEIVDIICNILSYITYGSSSQAKQKAYRSAIKFRKKCLLGSYSDGNLWRMFPAKRNLTIKDYKQQLRENNVMVTSRSNFQSWTKDIKEAMKYWRLTKSHIIYEPYQIPKSLVVESRIKGHEILLDTEDLGYYALDLLQDKELFPYREAMDHMEHESEVLVILKGRQAEVKSLKFINESIVLV